MKKHKITASLLLFSVTAVLMSGTAAAACGPAGVFMNASPIMALGSSPQPMLIVAGGITLMIFIAISVTAVKKLRQDRAERRNFKKGYSAYKNTASPQQEGIRYCPHCGSKQLTGSPFCAKCGKLIK
jgi:hypothetical protein